MVPENSSDAGAVPPPAPATKPTPTSGGDPQQPVDGQQVAPEDKTANMNNGNWFLRLWDLIINSRITRTGGPLGDRTANRPINGHSGSPPCPPPKLGNGHGAPER
ncbi:unnamed protein product [Urochloa decumbens]|uniref:Uncharacterized protein n=1 Tax=Urochloa decumbens TaxID=240449 RepID=A0ABC9DHB5_9POAL